MVFISIINLIASLDPSLQEYQPFIFGVAYFIVTGMGIMWPFRITLIVDKSNVTDPKLSKLFTHYSYFLGTLWSIHFLGMIAFLLVLTMNKFVWLMDHRLFFANFTLVIYGALQFYSIGYQGYEWTCCVNADTDNDNQLDDDDEDVSRTNSNSDYYQL